MTGVFFQHVHVVAFGWIGVWLFFILSGYVVTISTLARKAPGASRWTQFVGFYERRVKRILPIYLLYVVASFVVCGYISNIFEWKTFISLVTFWNNFEYPAPQGLFANNAVPHLWSISVEMQFYAIFSAVFFFLNRRALMTVLLMMVLIAPLIRLALGAVMSGFEPLRIAETIYRVSIAHFDAFAMGALLALSKADLDDKVLRYRIYAFAVIVLFGYFAVYASINYERSHHFGLRTFSGIISGVLYGDYKEVFLYAAIDILFVAVTVMALYTDFTRFPAPVVKALAWIGERSYGAYVYHWVILVFLRPVCDHILQNNGGDLHKIAYGLVLFCLSYPLTLLLAHLSFTLIEMPIIRWGRRPSSAAKPSATAS